MQKLISYLVFPGVLGGSMAAAWAAVGLDPSRHPSTLLAILGTAMMVIALCERRLPYRAEWNRSHGDVRSDLPHTLFSFSVTAKAVETLVWVALLGAAGRLAEWLGSGPWPVHWPLALQLLLSLLLSEIGLYAIHRAAHEVPWLWRLHAVHHSAPRLYWLNAGRFHPLDVVVQSVPGMLPLVLLGAPPQVLFLHWTFSGVHGLLQHCNVDMRLGGWNRVFSSADLHRWHHSRVVVEANHNYGKVLAIWDWLFRTRFLPDRPVGPLGLKKDGFPMGFWSHLTSPIAWEGFVAEADSPSPRVRASNRQENP